MLLKTEKKHKIASSPTLKVLFKPNTQECIISAWSKQAEGIFGYIDDEILGKNIYQLGPLENLHEQKKILSSLRHGRRIIEYETVRLRKDGIPIVVRMSIYPLLDKNNQQVIGASAFIKNITSAELFKRMKSSYLNVIEALVLALEAKDQYLHGHSKRVTKNGLLLANKFEYSAGKLKVLRDLFRIHDIGKLAISDKILNKKGKLTKKEWEQIKQHPKRGAKMVASLGFDKDSAMIILHHHERYDGLGYPDGLKNEQIPIFSRVLGVVDAFDAMTSNRPYREKMSEEEATHELVRCSGTQFCPRVVRIFIGLRKQPAFKFSTS